MVRSECSVWGAAFFCKSSRNGFPSERIAIAKARTQGILCQVSLFRRHRSFFELWPFECGRRGASGPDLARPRQVQDIEPFHMRGRSDIFCTLRKRQRGSKSEVLLEVIFLGKRSISIW